MNKTYLKLENLEVYKLARQLGRIAWEIYLAMDWQTKKIMGDQFIEAVDSVGANIAEGFGRFHFLDKNKFYFNARGSLLEAKHWLELLREREKVDENMFLKFLNCCDDLHPALNGLIDSVKTQKSKP
jgi:four helix bundle protein